MILATFEIKEAWQQINDEFAAGHEGCRRKYIDELGREGWPSRKRTRNRSGGYRRHFSQVVERDRSTCQICQVDVDLNAPQDDDRAPQLDHVIAVVDGGSDDITNLRLVHRWCNLARQSHYLHRSDDFVAVKARARFLDPPDPGPEGNR